MIITDSKWLVLIDTNAQELLVGRGGDDAGNSTVATVDRDLLMEAVSGTENDPSAEQITKAAAKLEFVGETLRRQLAERRDEVALVASGAYFLY